MSRRSSQVRPKISLDAHYSMADKLFETRIVAIPELRLNRLYQRSSG